MRRNEGAQLPDRLTSPHGAEAASLAGAAVRTKLGDLKPVCGIILGSGLGGLGGLVERAVSVPYASIPGFPSTTVAGHAGRLIGGQLGGQPVIALAGRFHLYEGHSPALAAFPVRVLHALGVTALIVSNAAGGVRRTLRCGDLMLIADHINLMWHSPLAGVLQPGDERFPDMSAPYDDGLRRMLRESALEQRIELAEGVYAGLLGPSYETAAEVRMLEKLGADAVGMSTVPEVITARALQMRVAGISCITNLACGVSPAPLSHEDVIAVGARVAEKFEALVSGCVARLGKR